MSVLQELPAVVFGMDEHGEVWSTADWDVPWFQALGLPLSAPEEIEALRPGQTRYWETTTPSPLAIRVRRQEHGATGIAMPLGHARRRSHWLNAAAHELVTPLTPIRIRLHTLLRSDLDPGVRRAIESVKRNFDRLEAVVSDLLEAERLEDKPPRVRPAVVTVDAWLAKSAPAWGAQFARRSGAVVTFDAEQAGRALERLVGRLRIQGHAHIEVGARTTEDTLVLGIRGERANDDAAGDLGLRLAGRLIAAQGGELDVTPHGYDVRLPIQGAAP